MKWIWSAHAFFGRCRGKYTILLGFYQMKETWAEWYTKGNNFEMEVTLDGTLWDQSNTFC